MDPPYKQDNIRIALDKIAKTKLLKESGLVVLHRHKKTDDDYGKNFNIIRSEKYGVSKVIFLRLLW